MSNPNNIDTALALRDETIHIDGRLFYVKANWLKPAGLSDEAWKRIQEIAVADLEEQKRAKFAAIEALS